jgi:hypothetical protein
VGEGPAALATPDLPGPRTSLLVGKTGFGKTSVSLARRDLWPRSIALDTKARHTGIPEYPGLAARNPRELADLLEEHGDRPRWRISYQGSVLAPVDPAKPDGPQSPERFFRALARVTNYLLIVEEAEKVMGANRKAPGGLYDMARLGRTLGQSLTLCCHRPADVDVNIRAVTEEVVVWPCQEPADRDALEDRGFDFDILESLQRYQSMRMHQPEGGRADFYICRCREPHAGHCGEALPRRALKFPEHQDKGGEA